MDTYTLRELYLKKDPKAVEEILFAHGYESRRMAMNILAGEREAETCVRESVIEMWDRVPSLLEASRLNLHLQIRTRDNAIQRYMADQSAKRGYNLFATILDELEECRPAPLLGLPTGDDTAASYAGQCISRFLKKKSRETGDIFLCRYFYAESLSEIARRFALNENRVKSRLRKTCKQLATFLAKEAQITWCPTSELLVRAMNYVDEAMILSAHGERKKVRRMIPWLVAVCAVTVVAVSFPFLRGVINTDLKLRGPDWNKDQDNPDREAADKPGQEDILKENIPGSVGGSTITVTEVTDTTVTLRLVKTNDTPIYAAVYDRMGDALACTQPDYKVDGEIIRSHVLKLYVNDSTESQDEFPTQAGTYTIVLDFNRVRMSPYPMEDYVGFFSYTGKDGAPEAVYFSILTPQPEADTTESPSADSQETP